MLDTPATQVPPLSLDDEARDPDAFAAALGGSFERFGFAVVSDHGVPTDLIARAWEMTAAFFALPEEQKRAYFMAGGGGARGYTPFKTEIAKGATHVDLKEFWHVGRELPARAPLRRSTMAPNVWPDRARRAFRETFVELFAAFDTAPATGCCPRSRGYLRPGARLVRSGGQGRQFSVLRLLHYPPDRRRSARACAPGAHEDINLITLLLGAEEAGLELLEPRRPLAGDQAAQGRDGGERRRHAPAADQPRPAVHHPPRRQPAARAPRPFALFDALLPPPRAGLPDRDASERDHRRGPSGPLPDSRSPRTTICTSGWSRSGW